MHDSNFQQQKINELSVELSHSANPVVLTMGPNVIFGKGLSKREWLAGMALQGLLAKEDWSKHDITQTALIFADEMLFKLNSTNKERK